VTALLDIRDVTVAYGNVVAVREVALTVAEGSMVALLGPNGAGKSSLIGAIAGLVRPRAGTIMFSGSDVTGVAAHRLARRRMRLVPETRALFADMSVLENLQVGAGRIGGGEFTARTRMLFELFPVLADRRSQHAGTLSGGEQQMLAIARALVAKPRLLLLDEPSMGLAPKVVGEIVAALAQLRDEGLTVVLAEQNARPVLPVVDVAAVFVHGRMSDIGPPDDISAALQAGYFGGQAPRA